MLPVRWIALFAPLWLAPGDGWLTRYDFGSGSVVQLRLPAELREVSGLAMDGRGRLFAHQDETSAVYEIDPVNGRVSRRFHVDREGLEEDFEGIAVAGNRMFLSTSEGDLLEFTLAAHGDVAPGRRVSTGLGELCELEGLAFDGPTGSLLLPCKTPRVRPLRERLVIFSVPLATLLPDDDPRISVSWAALEAVGLDDGFHPSAVEVHPRSGSFFLLSAPEEAIVEIGRDGEVLAGRRLPNGRHPQAEGIAFGPDLALWIADEGNRATLRRYPLSETASTAGAGAPTRARAERPAPDRRRASW